MKFEEVKNPNYVATVVKVGSTRQLTGLDNLVGVPVFGYQALVSKDTVVGSLAVVFTAETQLSDEFASANNLYRHADKNANPTEQGYLEDNRRVKALKLRGNQSDALLMPLEAFAYLGIKPEDFAVGDTFDVIDGHEICRKYLNKIPGESRNQAPKERRVEEKFFPVHIDTENYWRNSDKIAQDAEVIITQKLHGTSVRFGRTMVARKLTWKDRLAQRFGIQVSKTEFANIYGSRKVIKDPNDPDQQHFYQTVDNLDLWTATGKQFDDVIPDNVIVYAEIIGFTKGGEAIQKNYSYNLQPGEHEVYVYRVAVINNQGRMFDLSWDQLVEFTVEAGMKHVPELWRGKHSEFNADEWIDKRFYDEATASIRSFTNLPIPLSGSTKLVDEGVVVRAEGMKPTLLKAKSPVFLAHETKMLDAEAVDIEAEESVE